MFFVNRRPKMQAEVGWEDGAMERSSNYVRWLGCEDAPPLPSPLPLPSDRVILLDCDRTRGGIPFFREEGIQHTMASLLTLYCQDNKVGYKQGMNELLAPFIALRMPTHTAYACFSALIARILPHTFRDDEFVGLQASLRLVRLLLQYHAPTLARTLEQYDIVPELYATPWFITLFAHAHPLSTVFPLWDHYLESSASNPLAHFFVVLAAILHHHDLLSAITANTMAETLSQISLPPPPALGDILKHATHLQAITPLSFQHTLRSVAVDPLPTATACSLLAALEHLVCLPISATEAARLSSPPPSLPLPPCGPATLVDCRPATQYKAAHAPYSVHADPACLLDVEALNHTLDLLEAHRNGPLCLCSAGHISALAMPQGSHADRATQTLTMFALHLLQRGFPYVSTVDGGVRAVLAAVEAGRNGNAELGYAVTITPSPLIEEEGEATHWQGSDILRFPDARPPPNPKSDAGAIPDMDEFVAEEDSGSHRHQPDPSPSTPCPAATPATPTTPLTPVSTPSSRSKKLMKSWISSVTSASVSLLSPHRAPPPATPPPPPPPPPADTRGKHVSFPNATTSATATRDAPAQSHTLFSLARPPPVSTRSHSAHSSLTLGQFLDTLAESVAMASRPAPSPRPHGPFASSLANAATIEMGEVSAEELLWLQCLRDVRLGTVLDARSLLEDTQSFCAVFRCNQAIPCVEAPSRREPSPRPPTRPCVLFITSFLIFIFTERSQSSVYGESEMSPSKTEDGEEVPMLECERVWYIGHLAKISTRKSDPTRLTLKFTDDAVLGRPVEGGSDSDAYITHPLAFEEGLYECNAAIADVYKRVFLPSTE